MSGELIVKTATITPAIHTPTKMRMLPSYLKSSSDPGGASASSKMSSRVAALPQ
jgi:hypothetical protein